MAGKNNKAGRGSGGSVAAAPRFPVRAPLRVARNIVELEGRVRFRQTEAGRAQNSAWDIKAGTVRGNYAGMQRLADKRIASIKPAQRALDRYKRMTERAGYKPFGR